MKKNGDKKNKSDLSQPRRYKIMIVAGETSGDIHAAKVVKALKEQAKKRACQLEFVGMGFDAMRQAGVRPLVDASGMAVVGLLEVAKNIVRLHAVYRRIKKALAQERPDLLILVDYPGFNLRLAKKANALGIKVLYYIGPKIWAWKAWRIKTIRSCVSSMAVILPQEENIYRQAGVPVRYVGHPLLDQYEPPRNLEEKRAGKNILLLPGSRDSEIDHILPLLCDAAQAIRKQSDKVRFSLLCAPNIRKEKIASIVADKGLSCELLECSPWHAMHQADCAISASGTATLQLALCGKPMLVTYKMSWITYSLLRCLVRIPYISLVNIIAGKRVVKEYIQRQASADNISDEIISLLRDKRRYKAMQDELSAIRGSLGAPGAARRTAQIACELLDRQGRPNKRE